MTKPNIFTYATKELSQDAYICWSLAWINQTENREMRAYALDFLSLMLGKHELTFPNLHQLQSIGVEKQTLNIDVLITFQLEHIDYRLIIEDKTHTSMHSEQLKRYYNSVKEKANGKQVEILGIYYKTGFLYDNEIRVIEEMNQNGFKFQVLSRKDMLGIMRKHMEGIKGDLFHDYYHHLSELQRKEDELRNSLQSIDYEILKGALRTQEGQWLFMKELFKNLKNVSIYRGTSSGRPWTQCSFFKGRTKTDFPEALFYRLDNRREGTYLSLRQYFDYESLANLEFLRNEEMKIIRSKKVDRLDRLIDLFHEVLIELETESPDIMPVPGNRVTDKAGKKESEIGVFFFDREKNSEKMITFIPIFHKRFIEKVNERFGLQI